MIGWRTITACIAGVVLLGGFILGSYEASWGLFAASVNRTAKIQSQSYSAQNGYIQQIDDDWSAMTGDTAQLATAPDPSSVRTERLGSANDLCYQYSKVTGTVQVSPDVVAFARANCDGDAVSAASSYRSGISSNP